MWFQRLRTGRPLRMLRKGELEYLGIEKEKSLYTRGGAFFVSFLMFGYGIRTMRLYVCILAVVLFFASLMFKDTAITKKGAEIRYLLPGWHFESVWEWDEITHVLVDYQKFRPDVGMHIGKDMTHRICVVDPEDATELKEYIKKEHPAIRVADITN